MLKELIHPAIKYVAFSNLEVFKPVLSLNVCIVWSFTFINCLDVEPSVKVIILDEVDENSNTFSGIVSNK